MNLVDWLVNDAISLRSSFFCEWKSKEKIETEEKERERERENENWEKNKCWGEWDLSQKYLSSFVEKVNATWLGKRCSFFIFFLSFFFLLSFFSLSLLSLSPSFVFGWERVQAREKERKQKLTRKLERNPLGNQSLRKFFSIRRKKERRYQSIKEGKRKIVGKREKKLSWRKR